MTKSLHEYKSYREYLKDLYLNEKRSSKKVTLAEYAKRFGLGGSALNMILSGARNLTVSNLHEIARALKLSTSDHEYFEAMVLKEQAEDKQTQSYYSRRLNELNRERKVKSVRLSDKRILSNWIVPALLIHLIDFELVQSGKDLEKVNLESVGKRFGLKANEVKGYIELFQEMGLLEIDANDRVHIFFDKLAHHVPQKEYVRAVLNELSKRLEGDFENPQTLFRGFVFSIEKSQIPELRRELKDVFDKYMSKTSDNHEENEIIQALIGLFPVLLGSSKRAK